MQQLEELQHEGWRERCCVTISDILLLHQVMQHSLSAWFSVQPRCCITNLCPYYKRLFTVASSDATQAFCMVFHSATLLHHKSVSLL